ncbi:hypothetical protein B7463_g10931, partial [Scytalidium lignicola]
MSVFNVLRSIAAYAPIPLFAESLRVQQALVSTILTRSSVSPCLTGYIKDFHRLWELDDFELLGNFEGSPAASVISVRHGNTFQLANKAVLDACGITGRRSISRRKLPAYRETIVNLTFITPIPSPDARQNQRWRTWAASVLFILETGATIGASVIAGLYGFYIGSILLACVGTSAIILYILRQGTMAIFGNGNALHTDQYLTARGGAALDVHVIAEHWNSSRIDVICGYSSQLHALTNIPIRITNSLLVRLSCRILALVLVVQAASLASVPNLNGTQAWSGLLWLLVYALMILFKKALHLAFGPEQILENQPAVVQKVKPLRFSGRRAALVFIAALPVSYKFQTELEASDLFMTKSVTTEREKELSESEERSRIIGTTLDEATAALKRPDLVKHLASYEGVVFPPTPAQNRDV